MAEGREMQFFEDIEIGAVQTAGPMELTEADIIELAKQWDPLPMHIDPQAAKESVFGGFAAAGAHKICITNLLMHDMELPVIISVLAAEFRLPNPAMAGDRLSIELKIVEKTGSTSQPDERGTVVAETLFVNQDGVVVLKMEATHLVAKRPV